MFLFFSVILKLGFQRNNIFRTLSLLQKFIADVNRNNFCGFLADPLFHETTFTCRNYFHTMSFCSSASFTEISPLVVSSAIIFFLQSNPNYAKHCNLSTLTNFSPMSHFGTPWKRQKSYGLLTFLECVEMWHWTKMG